jgi:hypothetical protein
MSGRTTSHDAVADAVDPVMARAQWLDANRSVVDRLVDVMERRAGGDAAAEATAALDEARAACDPPAAIDQLADAFLLTDFERDLLSLAAAAELRPAVRTALGAAAGLASTAPTFALAARVLDAPHWTALGPGRPLRAAELVEIGAGPLPDAPIQLAERVLHHLLGVDDLAVELLPTAHRLEPAGQLIDSHERAAAAIVDVWRTDPTWPLVRLDVERHGDGLRVVSRVATLVGRPAHLVRGADVPDDPTARAAWARRWRRELTLAPHVLCVDVGDAPAARIGAFVDAVVGPVVVVGEHVGTLRAQRTIRVPVPSDEEQAAAWATAIDRHVTHVNGSRRHLAVAVERAIGQFRLGAAEIDEIAAGLGTGSGAGERLWQACRSRTRPALDALADRVESDATWDDLVLPADDLDTLEAISRHVANRARVHRAWGSRRGGRDRGITALFHGPSGTGKTLAAEVIANECGLDLYRIDLAGVVSKYIGETEKNLRQIFDAAEDGGAVLLFDEADALFGKRTEVRDSHDRYANIEVSYLLTRMETYRGLAVLTTNVRAAIDTSFLRRLRFVVGFPFPDEAQRERLWSRAFPAGVETVGLDTHRLARLGVTGATIHLIALHASYEAAADGGPVDVEHVRRAATRELAKLDRAPTTGEMAGLR